MFEGSLKVFEEDVFKGINTVPVTFFLFQVHCDCKFLQPPVANDTLGGM